MKNLYFVLAFLLISCGAGGSVKSTEQFETVDFKEIPQEISIFE